MGSERERGESRVSGRDFDASPWAILSFVVVVLGSEREGEESRVSEREFDESSWAISLL